MRVWKLIGHYNAETQTYSACAGALQTSPFTPDFDGRLVGLRTQSSAEAATSLQQHVQFRITHNPFKPNTIECYSQGNGLQTVPATKQATLDFAVDQPVKGGLPITVEGRNDVATGVTVSVFVYGLFEVQ